MGLHVLLFALAIALLGVTEVSNVIPNDLLVPCLSASAPLGVFPPPFF